MTFRANPSALLTLFFMAVCAIAISQTNEFSEQARLFPVVLGYSTLVLCAIQLCLDLFAPKKEGPLNPVDLMDLPVDRDVPPREVAIRASKIFGWIFGLFIGSYVVGFLISVPMFVFLYIAICSRPSWWTTIAITLVIVAVVFGIFDYIIHVPWPRPLVPLPQRVLINLLPP